MMRTVYLLKLVLVILFLASTHSKQAMWNDLATAITAKTMHLYGRTPQQETEYQLFRSELRNKNLTLPDHVKLNIFGLQGKAKLPIYPLFTTTFADIPIPVYLQAANPSSLNWLQLQPDSSAAIQGLKDIPHFALLTVNDFPYNLGPSIYHWVLWSNRQLQISFVKSIVNQVAKPTWQNLAYVNEPNQKSIPEIFHSQVFFYNPATTDQDL